MHLTPKIDLKSVLAHLFLTGYKQMTVKNGVCTSTYARATNLFRIYGMGDKTGLKKGRKGEKWEKPPNRKKRAHKRQFTRRYHRFISPKKH